jgi:hypothetical protein
MYPDCQVAEQSGSALLESTASPTAMSDLCLLATMVAKLQSSDQPVPIPHPVVTPSPNPRQGPPLKSWASPITPSSITPSASSLDASSDRLKAMEAELSQAIARPASQPRPTVSLGTQAGTQIGAQMIAGLAVLPKVAVPTRPAASSPAARQPSPDWMAQTGKPSDPQACDRTAQRLAQSFAQRTTPSPP